MRMKATAGVVLALAMGIVAAFGPNAAATSVVWYSGHVGPGQGVMFSINGKGKAQTFSPLDINFTMTCPATGDVFDSEWIFIGFEIPMQNGKFEDDESDPLFQTFVWKGTVGPSSASGHILAAFPAFDGKGGSQICTSGNEPWHAKALGGAPVVPEASAHAVVVTVTKADDGTIHYQIDR